jgi:hypothetical protein
MRRGEPPSSLAHLDGPIVSSGVRCAVSTLCNRGPMRRALNNLGRDWPSWGKRKLRRPLAAILHDEPDFEGDLWVEAVEVQANPN